MGNSNVTLLLPLPLTEMLLLFPSPLIFPLCSLRYSRSHPVLRSVLRTVLRSVLCSVLNPIIRAVLVSVICSIICRVNNVPENRGAEIRGPDVRLEASSGRSWPRSDSSQARTFKVYVLYFSWCFCLYSFFPPTTHGTCSGPDIILIPHAVKFPFHHPKKPTNIPLSSPVSRQRLTHLGPRSRCRNRTLGIRRKIAWPFILFY